MFKSAAEFENSVYNLLQAALYGNITYSDIKESGIDIEETDFMDAWDFIYDSKLVRDVDYFAPGQNAISRVRLYKDNSSKPRLTYQGLCFIRNFENNKFNQ